VRTVQRTCSYPARTPVRQSRGRQWRISTRPAEAGELLQIIGEFAEISGRPADIKAGIVRSGRFVLLFTVVFVLDDFVDLQGELGTFLDSGEDQDRVTR
ncbi:MAG: hypothetical protein ACREA0_12950, partial [bacterium]